MEAFLNLIAKFIDKLKIKEVILAMLLVGIVVLFVPIDIIRILGLNDWREKYRSIIGLIILFCAVCCLIWFFTFLKDKIFPIEKKTAKFVKKYLRKLISTQEKEFLINNYYNFEIGEFAVTAHVDMLDGCVTSLTNAFIIYRASNMGYGPNNWSYNLQPIAQRYLNKAVYKKEIIITRKGYKW